MRYTRLYRRPLLPVVSRFINCVEWPEGSLDDLLPGERWRGLTVSSGVSDLSAIDRMPNLEELSIGPYCSGTFRLESLPKLRDLGVEVGPGRKIVPAGGELLESVFLDACTRPWALWLESLPRLKRVRLDRPRTLPQRLPESVEVLDIALVTKWDARVERIEGSTSLRELHLTGLRGMSDLGVFSSARNLEFLYAEDCDELVSTDGPGWSEGASARYVGRTPVSVFPPQPHG